VKRRRAVERRLRLGYAPRVPIGPVARLYKADAMGIEEEELLTDVGWRLYARCQDVLLVGDRRVRCPECRTVFGVPPRRPAPDAPFVRVLPSEARDLVALTLERFRVAFDRLGTGPDVFGLVHADLHQFNVLLHRGQVRAIDFDDCCFGHYLYDLAVALVGAGPWRTTPGMRAAFLAGYRRERRLPAALEGMLGTFMALRRLLLLRWALGDADPAGPVVDGVLATVRADLATATDG
jgi:hypothetical protein